MNAPEAKNGKKGSIPYRKINVSMSTIICMIGFVLLPQNIFLDQLSVLLCQVQSLKNVDFIPIFTYLIPTVRIPTHSMEIHSIKKVPSMELSYPVKITMSINEK